MGQMRRARPGRRGLLQVLQPALAAASLLPACCAGEEGAEAQRRKQDVKRFEELLAWLEAGIEEAGLAGRHKKLEDTFELAWGEFGRALAAKRDCAEGELVALVPTSRFIYDRDYARQEGLQGYEPWQESAVYMARQRALGEESRWSPLLRMLPDSYPQLPKHWPKELIEEHLQGTLMQTQVFEDLQEHVTSWETVKGIASDITWEDYEWGHDTFTSRAAFWNGTEREGSVVPRRVGTSALYPLHDLVAHGLPSNLDYTFDRELQALRLTVTTPVKRGKVFFIGYFKDQQRDNQDILTKWGFTSPDARKVATVQVHPDPEKEVKSFPLEFKLDDEAAEAFMAMLRAMTWGNRPLMGSAIPRELPEKIIALPEPNSGWIYWWNETSDETFWVLPGDPDRPYIMPPTNWEIEAQALKMAEDAVRLTLSRYRTTLTEDLRRLKEGIADPRVRDMVVVRSDEKAVLRWWLAWIRRALGMKGRDEEKVDVAAVYDSSEVHLQTIGEDEEAPLKSPPGMLPSDEL